MLEHAEVEALQWYQLIGWTAEEASTEPEKAAAEALGALESNADKILVHFDVDAIDSTDLPLANYPHFNLGQPFDSAIASLDVFCASQRFAGLVVTEVNPDHDADGSLLSRLIDALVGALSNPKTT